MRARTPWITRWIAMAIHSPPKTPAAHSMLEAGALARDVFKAEARQMAVTRRKNSAELSLQKLESILAPEHLVVVYVCGRSEHLPLDRLARISLVEGADFF